MSAAYLGLLLTALSLFCSGCTIPVSENPLVNPAEAKPDTSLYGTFRAIDETNEQVGYMHIGPAGENFPAGFMRILLVSQNEVLESEHLLGFVEKIGRYHVLHIPEIKVQEIMTSQRTAWDLEWDIHQVEGYLLVRLLVTDDNIELTFIENDFLIEQIEAQKLSGQIQREEQKLMYGLVKHEKVSITITADSDDLREFFSQHIDGKLLSEQVMKFMRIP